MILSRFRSRFRQAGVGALLAAGVHMLAACSDLPSSSTPDNTLPTADASRDIIDAARGGSSGFYWLPPTVVTSPSTTGTFDNSLLQDLVVELCEFDGTTCSPTGLRRVFTHTTGSVLDRVRLFPNRQYQVMYASARDNLDPARNYRVTVRAFGEALGVVDVDVVATTAELSRVDRSRFAALLVGQTLPITFRVEVTRAGQFARLPANGGTSTLQGGAVALTLPPGAVDSDVVMSAVPLDVATLPAGGRRLVPGTAWDFGPDGLRFATPAVLTLRFDPSRLPAGTDPAELRIHKRVGDSYVQQPAGRVDLVASTVSAETDGFSTYVIIARDPSRLEDRDAPTVLSAQVRSPSMPAFADLVELDVSGADAPYIFRVGLRDDGGSGVSFVDVRYQSPSGRQERFPCYRGGPPNSGSDTFGEWDCETSMPRFAEAGDWTPVYVRFEDRVNNRVDYFRQPGGVCNNSGACLDFPIIRVLPGVNDVTLPIATSLGISANTTPRLFVNELAAASLPTSQRFILGFRATDDLSGAGFGLFFDVFAVELQDPAGRAQLVYPSCQLTSGTAQDGFWECQIDLPALAAEGTWRLARLKVPDRAGNGGWAGWPDDYLITSDGSQLCRRTGGCVVNPRIVVGGTGDASAPTLEALTIANVEQLVTTTLRLVDVPSGVGFVRVLYRSRETTQFQQCFAQLQTGTVQDGMWGCDIAFPAAAASGIWDISLEVADRTNNRRFYDVRRSDGALCTADPVVGQLCRDFGFAGVEFINP